MLIAEKILSVLLSEVLVSLPVVFASVATHSCHSHGGCHHPTAVNLGEQYVSEQVVSMCELDQVFRLVAPTQMEGNNVMAVALGD